MKYLASASALGFALALALGCATGCASSSSAIGGTGTSGGDGTGGASGFDGGLLGAGGGSAAMPLRATGIAVGSAHTCALLTDGTVACWGDDTHGQLGNGSAGAAVPAAAPAVVAGLTGVTAIRAGGDTTCAIAGGGVRCWGDGAFGQLGDGMSGDGYLSSTPVAVTGLDGVADLAVSAGNACAVKADGTVRCWGRNASDQWLGFASIDCGPYIMVTGNEAPTLVSVPCEATPREVPGASGALAVAVGGEHNCVREALGGASCWGADAFGQLGDGMSGLDAHQPSPTAVQGVGKVLQLAVGASHTCGVVGPALDVRCWGDNSYGQLGIGTQAIDSYKTTPAAVKGVTGVVDLDAAGQTTCAALPDGTVSCWGDTTTVLPVSPNMGTALVPTPVPGVVSAVEVRTSGGHACARLVDQSVVCWGLDDHGQLGNGATHLADFSLVPVPQPLAQGNPG